MLDLNTLCPNLARPPGGASTDLDRLRSSGGRCLLASFGVVSVSGADALTFLHGQFTSDCTTMNDGHAQFSAWCDAKGRTLETFMLVRAGSDTLLITPRARIDSFIRRLRMFVLRANVTIVDASDACTLIGASGEAAVAAGVENGTAGSTSTDTAGVIAIPTGHDGRRVVFMAPDERAAACWARIDVPILDECVWQAADCLDGIPWLDDATSGEYVPQYLNLDVMNAVSFSKGCYPGQEIVARLRYRGQVKRRLAAATVVTDNALAARANIVDVNGDTAGRILRAVTLNDGLGVISAVLETDRPDGPLALEGTADSELTVHPLPYTPE